MKSTATWMFTTWLALIALQAVVSKAGSGRIGSLFADANNVLNRALDPNVPAIPDHRTTTTTTTSTTTTAPAAAVNPTPTPRLPPAGSTSTFI